MEQCVILIITSNFCQIRRDFRKSSTYCTRSLEKARQSNGEASSIARRAKQSRAEGACLGGAAAITEKF